MKTQINLFRKGKIMIPLTLFCTAYESFRWYREEDGTLKYLGRYAGVWRDLYPVYPPLYQEEYLDRLRREGKYGN